MQPSFPKKFTILVAALKSSSDPSRGPSGNPKVARGGFVLQQIVPADGRPRIGGPIIPPATPSPANYTAAIQVATAQFWDPTVAAPPPLYLKEEVALFGQYITASEEFGEGEGGGAGPVAAVATGLAKALNTYLDIKAVAVADTVYIISLSASATLPIKATDDMSVILAGVPFLVKGPGGVVLSTSPNYRQTFFVVKPLPTLSPPISLPPISP